MIALELYSEIEKSFPVLEKLFSKYDILEFKNTPIMDLCLYHFGFGTWIRNNLLYTKDSVLYSLFLKAGINHPDDMSIIIIEQFHNYIH